MLSKTILIGLSIFWFGGSSQNTVMKILLHGVNLIVLKECHFNDRAGKCGVVRFTTQFSILDKAKALPIRI